MLKKIEKEEIRFSDDTGMDGVSTCLKLMDYDWMQYILQAEIRTEYLGVLYIEFEYAGTDLSIMTVKQKSDRTPKQQEYVYKYDSDLFILYLGKFMAEHLEQWKDGRAFSGEDIVLAFYNDVIESGTQIIT